MQASQCVENRTLTGVWIAGQRNNIIRQWRGTVFAISLSPFLRMGYICHREDNLHIC